jgi:effector-binding domain-containing protein
MAYTCELLEQTEQPTLCVRTRTPVENLPQTLGKAYGAIMETLGERSEMPVGPAYVAYFNMDMQDLDIEAGFPVAHEHGDHGDVKHGAIPAGKYATCTHVGPYDQMAPAYETLGQWMKEKQLTASGTVYELYFNSPADTLPQDLKTQILFPLIEA